MIDIHSHLLPKVDDGSRSVDESVQMLSALAEQGIGTVFATPHFYAWRDTPENFLKRRDDAFETLRERMTPDLPEVKLGAEVAYFEGIGRSQSIPELSLQGTDFLLIEMPFEKWNPRMISEVVSGSQRFGLQIVLAHIERYGAYYRSGDIEMLLQNNVLLQMNAEALAEKKTRRSALRLFKSGCISAIGSDCHNMTDRAPRMKEAADVLKEAFGEEALENLI